MDSRSGRRGAALLLTLVIVGLLSLAVVEFLREARFESVSAANTLSMVEAQAMARSGVAAGIAILKNDADNSTTDDRTEFWYTGEGTEEGLLVPVGETIVSLKIDDLYGRFPIGALLTNGKVNNARYDAFVRLLDALELEGANSEDLASALVDWMDEDTVGSYEFNADFTVPDAPPEHADELGRVSVFKDLPRAELNRILNQIDTRSDPAINVNTASVPVLMAFHPRLSLEEAEQLHDELFDEPLASDGPILTLIPRKDRAFSMLYSSKRFAFTVKADVREIRKEIRCVVNRGSTQEGTVVEDWIQN